MKNDLGVTRWLVAPRAVVVQAGVILLLLGIVVGQNVERVWHLIRPPAAEPSAAEVEPQAVAGAIAPVEAAGRAVPGAPRDASPRPAQARPGPAQAGLPQPGAVPDFTVLPARREAAPVARLTGTERWITSTAHDPTKRGYSVWAALRPGGNLIIERCRAPDAGAQASCEVVLDQVIAVIGETRIDLGNGRSFGYSLVHRDGVEVLHLSLAEELELVPGTKPALVKHLRELTEEAPIRGRWARTSPRQRVARN
ncbi:MAG: hypothetical protein QM704_02640 [Anaeromyxobacteraceae bacterium]